MAEKPRPFAEDAFRKIMKIAELTADPARVPELRDGVATVVNQLKTDVAKLGAERGNQQLLLLRRKLESALTSPPPTTIKTHYHQRSASGSGAGGGLEEKPGH